MFTYCHHQHPFAYLRRIRLLCHGDLGFRPPPSDKCQNHQRCNSSQGYQSLWHKKRFPPARSLLVKSRGNPSPHPLPVVLTWIRDRHRIQCSEHGFDTRQLLAAFGAFLQVRSYKLALLYLAVAVADQLFFRPVFHPSIPIARASFPSRNGVNARRNFCTARKTVFFFAIEIEFSPAAISSIMQPSQCRITIAVLPAGLSSSSPGCSRSP